jgi:formate hydrogenlyase subunit 3/multisubunit Na+/H+ antiporter MnhD subunit
MNIAGALRRTAMTGPEATSACPWLAGVVAAPLIAACAMIALRRRLAVLGWLGGLAATGATAALAYRVALYGPQQMSLGGWAAPLGIPLYADGMSVGMLGVTALIAVFVGIYAPGYFQPPAAAAPAKEAAAFFWPLGMFLWTGLNALFVSADLFAVYVAVEVLGIASVALAALSREPAALAAAVRYLLVSLLGSLSYLLGVAFIYAGTGALGMALIKASVAPAPFSYAALALMSAGLVMKSALFPLHFWLPPAHANAPAPVSALLSALVVKASFYVLLRLWFEVFADLVTDALAAIPGVLGSAAIVWGSIQALSAGRLKQLIAYSTVAQVGYLFLVFPLGAGAGAGGTAWSAALYFLLAHACAKAAVFMAAGNVQQAFGHDRIDDLQGAVQQLPLSMFAFAVAGVSLIGLPPSGGFIAKWLFLSAALEAGRWGFAAVIVAGSLLATAYIFRFFSRAFRHVPEGARCHALPASMEWSALALALCSLALGLTAAPVLDWLQTGLPFTASAAIGGRP